MGGPTQSLRNESILTPEAGVEAVITIEGVGVKANVVEGGIKQIHKVFNTFSFHEVPLTIYVFRMSFVSFVELDSFLMQ